jgi:hypothetical protein
MDVARRSLLLFLGVVVAAFAILPSQEKVQRHLLAEGWMHHPALAEPDGRSHRCDRMVAADIQDSRVLAELSSRFRQTEPMQLTPDGEIRGTRDFERRQEYLLRLLDYYWFGKPRLIGMSRAEVEAIFGPVGEDAKRAKIPAGRNTLHLWFKDGRVSGAFYAMGY